MTEGVPRAINVERFVEARSREIHILQSTLVRDGAGGANQEALPRHLRRRATSHKPYRHKRRPNLKLRDQLSGKAGTDGAPGCRVEGSGEVPRPQNRAMRRRRGRLQQSFQASCRQAPAPDPVSSHGTPQGTGPLWGSQPKESAFAHVDAPDLLNAAVSAGPHEGTGAGTPQATQKLMDQEVAVPQVQLPVPRHAQGLPEGTRGIPGGRVGPLKQAAVRKGVANVAAGVEGPGKRLAGFTRVPVGSTPLGTAGIRHLETHVWHAKRMSMVQRWGTVLAGGAAGKGLGSRSLLHKLHSGLVLHDASYLCPFQLEGPQASLIAGLGLLCEARSIARISAAAQGPMREVELLLHAPGRWPWEPITPALFMWEPLASAGHSPLPMLATPSTVPVDPEFTLGVPDLAMSSTTPALQIKPAAPNLATSSAVTALQITPPVPDLATLSTAPASHIVPAGSNFGNTRALRPPFPPPCTCKQEEEGLPRGAVRPGWAGHKQVDRRGSAQRCQIKPVAVC
eukprot:jgi/Botrbrau1/7497/Bobra.0095s0033.1